MMDILNSMFADKCGASNIYVSIATYFIVAFLIIGLVMAKANNMLNKKTLAQILISTVVAVLVALGITWLIRKVCKWDDRVAYAVVAVVAVVFVGGLLMVSKKVNGVVGDLMQYRLATSALQGLQTSSTSAL